MRSPTAKRPTPASTQASVRAAIATLPGPQRQVLTEVYYRDRSVAETAHILQIPPGTVKSRTFYALRALRHALAAHDAAVKPLRPTPPQPAAAAPGATPATWPRPGGSRGRG